VTGGVRLAVWSGPRNISTALMRSWENRPDTRVTDEPLYAHYLSRTGLDHPGRDAVIAAGETSWPAIVAGLTAPVDGIHYQKHMSHHLLPDLPRDWISELTNVLLIRDPHEVVASYLKSRDQVTVDDIGLRQQNVLYDELSTAGHEPRIIDAADFLGDPEHFLRGLCALVDVEFERAMLHWPAGPRSTDGVWAPYWYHAVWNSTGFAPYHRRDVELTGSAVEVAAECTPLYQRLRGRRWTG
jgi:sulfotransferase family protein